MKLKWVNVTPLQRGARTPNGGAVFGSRLRIVRLGLWRIEEMEEERN